jgi:predicted GTPase
MSVKANKAFASHLLAAMELHEAHKRLMHSKQTMRTLTAPVIEVIATRTAGIH